MAAQMEKLIAYLQTLPPGTSATTMIAKGMAFLNSTALAGSVKKLVLTEACKVLGQAAPSDGLQLQFATLLATIETTPLLSDLIETIHMVATRQIDLAVIKKDIEDVSIVGEACMPVCSALGPSIWTKIKAMFRYCHKPKATA